MGLEYANMPLCGPLQLRPLLTKLHFPAFPMTEG